MHSGVAASAIAGGESAVENPAEADRGCSHSNDVAAVGRCGGCGDADALDAVRDAVAAELEEPLHC